MLNDIAFGLFGLAVLMGLGWVFSAERRAVPWRLVGMGVLLQVVFALLVLRTSWGRAVFEGLSRVFVKVIDFTRVGSEFIFGDLTNLERFGFVFAIQVLPTIIFFASLMAVLYHLGIMQRIVQAMAWVMTRAMGVSGAESLAVAANVFVGQTEAPLVVRPYLNCMTRSELFTTMVGGMATIAGGVLAAYVGLLGGVDPEQQLYYAKHLLSASIMAAPGTVLMAKILQPETDESLTKGSVQLHVERTNRNVIEAAANGAADGVKLALNVGGMLLAFLALIAMINYPLQLLGEYFGIYSASGQPLDLALILGWILSPIAWVIGVPWGDAVNVGGLIGQKVVANEFVAYSQFNEIKDTLSDKAVLISTYALCGFANFSSIAIQLGGIGGLAPDRKPHIAAMGLKAVLGGTLVTLMTATIAGVVTALA
ncbi:MAG: nucleoside transporter [Wenzhouxiangellaceae bacterium]